MFGYNLYGFVGVDEGSSFSKKIILTGMYVVFILFLLFFKQDKDRVVLRVFRYFVSFLSGGFGGEGLLGYAISWLLLVGSVLMCFDLFGKSKK